MFRLNMNKDRDSKIVPKGGWLYKILVAFSSIIITVAIAFLIVWAGNLNPSSAPGDTMKTLDDIYYRLDKDASATSSWGLDSPASPTSTMYTLQEIFDKTPDFHDNPGSATVGDVCNSATFYTDSATKLTGTRTSCGPYTQIKFKAQMGTWGYSTTDWIALTGGTAWGNCVCRQVGTMYYKLKVVCSGGTCTYYAYRYDDSGCTVFHSDASISVEGQIQVFLQ